jgi:hypothetical protein
MYRKRSLIMDNKLKNIILEYKSLPNKDLEYGLKKISEDFEETKELIIKLTRHLDSLENNYNNILKEFKSRNS